MFDMFLNVYALETLHPGIYTQRVKGTPPMIGVGTSTAAFIGTAPKGRVNESYLVTNWSQYVNEYGGLDANSYLGYAVKQFFENGGTKAYINRVTHYASGVKQSAVSTNTVKDSTGTNPVIKVDAINDGVWGDNIDFEPVKYDAETKKITVRVYYEGLVVKEYKDVSMFELDDIIKQDSKLIRTTVLDFITAPKIEKVSLASGNDGLTDITDSDYIGDQASGTGLYAFDNDEINIIAIPGITTSTAHAGLITYIEGRKDCFAVLDSPLGKTPTEIKEYRETNNISTNNGSIYYPWIEFSDPIGIGKNPTKFLPPSGAVVGNYARTDVSRAVWKAPAGIDNKIMGAIGLEYNVNDSEQDILNPIGVNCIRSFKNQGIVIWGARTLASDLQYMYVPVSRYVLYIESTLKKSMPWVNFEPNDESLWNKIKSSVEKFLRLDWKQGATKGKKESDAFYVACDGEINTQEVIDAGLTYCDIGISPNKPNEFMVFRINLRS